jgi:glycosyltransferase involved in cell wall biosynthesis/CheY-like chemotaxis protein
MTTGAMTRGTSARLRVGLISHSGGDGGAERSLLDLIDALSPQSLEFRVVVPEEGYLSSALEVRAIPYLVYRYWPWAHPVPLAWWDRRLKKPLAHLMRAATVARRIRPWRCDFIVTNTLTICEGALAARMLGLPHITYAREFGDLDHGFRFELGPKPSMRLLSLLSARVVFNSAALANHYAGQVSAAKSRVIYNAVPVPPNLPPGAAPNPALEPTFSCVLVASLIPGKGHGDAIRAVAHLRDRGIPVRLTIAGGSGLPTYHRAMRDLIESLGVSSLVQIVGPVTDPWRLFRDADVTLMCSRAEAFGRVTVEAMKLGRPVVGTNSGGTPEIIRDRFNGLLYAPGDARDLADKIERLARDPESTKEMGERARRFATEMFNLDRYGREFLSLLEELVGERGPRAGHWTKPRKSQILVVEDDPLVAQWLAESLGAEGYEVDITGNGRTALEQLDQRSYDLILSDLRMPEIDGVGLYRVLERARPQAARRMLFLTGNPEFPEYRDFVAEKRAHIVDKPVDLNELNRMARQVLTIEAK